MPDKTALKRTQITEKIKNLILTRKVRHGEQLSERELAKTLGVARGTVRESIVKLTNEGLVENIPGVGVFVKNYTDDEISEQIYIRSILEGAAAKFAAARINRQQSRELLLMLGQLKESFDNADTETNRQIDIKIHRKIAEISGIEYLESLISASLGIRIMMYIDLPPKGKETSRHLVSVDEHRAIIEAVIEGEAEKAEQLMRAHITKSIKTFLDLIHGTTNHR